MLFKIRLMIEFIKNNESYFPKTELNLLRFQIRTTEFCSDFYVKELKLKNNSTFY